MDTEAIRQRLIRAARAISPDDRVPHAFEKGILARIRRVPAADPIALWTRLLWRAIAPCSAVMLLVGLGSLLLADPAADEAVVPTYATLMADFESSDSSAP